MDLYSAAFNGEQLNDTTFTKKVMWHDFDRMPDSVKSIAPITHAHRSVSTTEYWVQKSAQIVILTRGCPKNVLDARIARIRQLLQRKGTLVLQKGIPTLESDVYEYDQYETLTYTSAILDTVDFDTKGINSVVTINLILLDPVAKGGTPQTLYSGTITTGTTNIDLSAVDIQGTFDNQYPVYTFTFNSVTPGSTHLISISNDFSTITIDNTVQAGDVLVVDTDSLVVTLNGDQIDFTGVFPTIQDPLAPITITDTYSARNITASIVITPRYI